ncbi:hypothetical protein KI387_029203, partial [Taxus chinensis]
RYASILECLEDLTDVLTMERQPLELESMEEVAARLKEEDRLKVIALISEYSKVLTDGKIASQSTKAAYDTCVDRDKVASSLVTKIKVELKEFQEKNKGNRAERDKVLAKLERRSEEIETLRGSTKTQLKELYPQITRRIDKLADLGMDMEQIVDTLGTQGAGLSFDE